MNTRITYSDENPTRSMEVWEGDIRGAFNKFPDFFTGISNCRRLLKIQNVIAIHRMR